MRIGITSRINNVNNKEVYMYYKRYTDYLECEIIMILPNQSNEVLDMCDAFIICGGDDLNPSLYNEENMYSDGVNDSMDIIDFKVIEYAIRKNKKILGICRGIQSLNVFLGGTLIQHKNGHMDVNHVIKRVVNPRICDLGIEVEVNSYHHQTIGEIGDNLICTYKSFDGVVEVLEHINNKIIAVQFHPEIKINDISKILFNFLIN